MKRAARRMVGALDLAFEYLGVFFLAAMVLIVTWQVISRQGLGTTPQWSAEVSLILMVWIGFMGIALGFRERIHISIEILVRRLPGAARKWIDRFVYCLVFVFGLYLLVEGAQFTVETSGATLPSTGLPRSTLYVIMPITGFMVCVYTVLQALGIPTERYGKDEPEASADEYPE